MLDLIQNKNLTLDEIKNYYLSSCKPKNLHKIGLEYERISINSTTKKADLSRILKTIEEFSKNENWELILDDNILIGAKKDKTSISLEPGGQFEISLSPKNKISEIEFELKKILNSVDEIAKKNNIEFLTCGINPNETFENIEILPKKRYLIMADYFNKNLQYAHMMMRETAGIQINIDYESEEDAVLKYNFLNKILPFLTGLFANSKIRNNKNTGFESFRSEIWRHTDPIRCGEILLKINSFEDYIEKTTNIPMILIEKNEEKIPIKNMSFKNYTKNNMVNLEDYLLHASLIFPDIRLKNFIEIRNHDSNTKEVVLALCAFYKGLIQDMEIIKNLDKKINLSEENIKEIRYLASKFGTKFKLDKFLPNYTVKTLLNELLNIAKNNLSLEERDFLSIMENKIQTL